MGREGKEAEPASCRPASEEGRWMDVGANSGGEVPEEGVQEGRGGQPRELRMVEEGGKGVGGGGEAKAHGREGEAGNAVRDGGGVGEALRPV